MLPRPCIVCGVPGPEGRCAAHQLVRRPDYGNRERLRRAQVVMQHIQVFGQWCPGWGKRGPHDVESPDFLTADHLIPVGSGGSEAGSLQALCNRCNSAKGARRGDGV